jgi:hypothetical protein
VQPRSCRHDTDLSSRVMAQPAPPVYLKIKVQ